MLDPPSVLERRLRQRIGEMVAQQAVEDEGAIQAPKGQGLYHRYNAILKRCTGDKPRAQMSVQDLEAAVSWLERNRLADHAHLLEGDPRYGWTLRQRGEWKPPVGNADGRPRGAPVRSAFASAYKREDMLSTGRGEITRTGLFNKPTSYPT